MIKDPFEALEASRSKNLIEKTFDNLKDHLQIKRTHASSEENLESKFFVALCSSFLSFLY